MEIIRQRETKRHIEHKRVFTIVGESKGNGYAFPCLPDGTPDTSDETYEIWKANFERCLASPDEYDDDGVEELSWTYAEPAVGLCSCGNEVELVAEYMGACQCDKCGRWYNIFGQSLKSPEFWDEID